MHDCVAAEAHCQSLRLPLCFLQGLQVSRTMLCPVPKSPQWFKNLLLLPFLTPLCLVQKGSQGHSEQHASCVTSERCYLITWCCYIQIVPHCLSSSRHLAMHITNSTCLCKKKKKDTKEGSAESQTKVEFMGK